MPKYKLGDKVYYAPLDTIGEITRIYDDKGGDFPQQYGVTCPNPAEYLANEDELQKP